MLVVAGLQTGAFLMWKRIVTVNDTEARDAVRQLLKRFELIAAQGAGLAYVLAKRDPQEYARLLESAELAITMVIQPLDHADAHHNEVYSVLDDPEADWPKAIIAMLNRGPIQYWESQAIERFKFVRGLEEQFDAENKKRNQNG